MGADISTFDVTAIFDDSTLRLADGGWAIKAFAILSSSLEQAMLLDADAVFLQKIGKYFRQSPWLSWNRNPLIS